MIKGLISIVLILLPWTGQETPFWKSYEKQVRKELTKWSESETEVHPLRVTEGREIFDLRKPASGSVGTLVLTSASGRFDRFDLMVVLDTQNEVEWIRILKYRSDFGSEVMNKSWLSQFYHLRDSVYVLNKNIDGISGATYSSGGLVTELNIVRRLVRNGAIQR